LEFFTNETTKLLEIEGFSFIEFLEEWNIFTSVLREKSCYEGAPFFLRNQLIVVSVYDIEEISES